MGSSNFGDGLNSQNKNRWSFNNGVASSFPEHVERSVPGYKEGHSLILDLVDFFISDKSCVLEIGSSCGDLLYQIYEKYSQENISFIGIDSVKEMIDMSLERHNISKENKKISFLNEDVMNYKFPKTSIVISYYTMQFIHPSVRQNVFDKIYKSLNWGGAFILFEKVRGPDARFQDIMNQLYIDYKLRKKYTPDQIIQKSKSLKGILEPFSTQGNIDLAKRSGFIDHCTIFKNICFEGILFIK